MEMDPVEGLAARDFRAVCGCSGSDMEWPRQPAGICGIRFEHMGLLVQQRAQDPDGKSGMCIALLADL